LTSSPSAMPSRSSARHLAQHAHVGRLRLRCPRLGCSAYSDEPLESKLDRLVAIDRVLDLRTKHGPASTIVVAVTSPLASIAGHPQPAPDPLNHGSPAPATSARALALPRRSGALARTERWLARSATVISMSTPAGTLRRISASAIRG
jgi:hypothetical protein